MSYSIYSNLMCVWVCLYGGMQTEWWPYQANCIELVKQWKLLEIAMTKQMEKDSTAQSRKLIEMEESALEK